MDTDAMRFAQWLRTERGVIGEDVNLDVLYAQWVDDEPYCNHDAQALTPIMGHQCECGELIDIETI